MAALAAEKQFSDSQKSVKNCLDNARFAAGYIIPRMAGPFRRPASDPGGGGPQSVSVPGASGAGILT